eukprot:9075498-Ditylum_brightwellii.AAC.1
MPSMKGLTAMTWVRLRSRKPNTPAEANTMLRQASENEKVGAKRHTYCRSGGGNCHMSAGGPKPKSKMLCMKLQGKAVLPMKRTSKPCTRQW